MRKILIFGNSGSGKSTLARDICAANQLVHLDLDSIAWQHSSPPEREPIQKMAQLIDEFIASNQGWVIEGCYTDLLELATDRATEIIFLNLPVEACISNARNRPWERHKYVSKQAQDNNLQMLLNWIGEYHDRDGPFSYAAHQKFYDSFAGSKTMYASNDKD
jgi:adenylate kinase family enzyme